MRWRQVSRGKFLSTEDRSKAFCCNIALLLACAHCCLLVRGIELASLLSMYVWSRRLHVAEMRSKLQAVFILAFLQ